MAAWHTAQHEQRGDQLSWLPVQLSKLYSATTCNNILCACVKNPTRWQPFHCFDARERNLSWASPRRRNVVKWLICFSFSSERLNVESGFPAPAKRCSCVEPWCTLCDTLPCSIHQAVSSIHQAKRIARSFRAIHGASPASQRRFTRIAASHLHV